MLSDAQTPLYAAPNIDYLSPQLKENVNGNSTLAFAPSDLINVPFIDGSVQMKENIRFLLRVASDFSFSYTTDGVQVLTRRGQAYVAAVTQAANLTNSDLRPLDRLLGSVQAPNSAGTLGILVTDETGAIIGHPVGSLTVPKLDKDGSLARGQPYGPRRLGYGPSRTERSWEDDAAKGRCGPAGPARGRGSAQR